MSLLDKENYKPRIVDSLIESYLEVSGAVCIEGPKWCGKTWTSSFHSNSGFFVGDPQNNFVNRSFAELNPSSILDGETPRLIDEWQEVPSIWDAVRAEVDKRNKKGQIILTGSSTPPTKGVLHSGAGRIAKIRMNTMSLFESGDSTGDISLKDICSQKFTSKLFEDVDLNKLAYLLVRGGWPGNIATNKSNAHLMPHSYLDAILNEDLNKLSGGEYINKHKFELLLKSLARNESTTVSDCSLIKDIAQNDNESISRNSLNKYLEILDRMFLTNNQLPFAPNIRSSIRVKQMEKRHFFDPAFACALLNLTPDKLIGDLRLFGFLFEALVERDLSIYAQSFGAKLYHYQDYKNNEIDAVIELDDGNWCAFEIKLGLVWADEAAQNLNKISQAIEDGGGKAPIVKCVIYGVGNAAYLRKDGVYVVPITALKN